MNYRLEQSGKLATFGGSYTTVFQQKRSKIARWQKKDSASRKYRRPQEGHFLKC